MKVLVIHLSDIHIKEADVGFPALAYQVVESVSEDYRSADLCIMALTGDIAYGGKKVEYKIAEKFIENFNVAIRKEKNIDISLSIAPGNHDCNFEKNSKIRDLLIGNIVDNPELCSEDEVVEECTKIQQEFNDFSDKYDKDVVFKDKLWKEKKLMVGEDVLNISVINASWMSSISEKQGALVFPVDKYKNVASNNDFRISLIHHPLNWYCQNSYHPLRHLLQSQSSIILSGHEHTPNGQEVLKANTSSALYFEAAAFEAASDRREFSVLNIDMGLGKVEKKHYKQVGNHFENSNVEIFNTQDRAGASPIRGEFLQELSEIGANLRHPCKNSISISDVSIPLELSSELNSDVIDSDDLDVSNKRIMISGDEASGKTKLLHSLYFRELNRSNSPLYIDALKIKRTTLKEFKKYVDSSLMKQYKRPELYKKLPREKRVIFIDDVEGLGLDKKGFSEIAKYITDQFGSVVIVSGQGLLLSGVLSKLQKMFDFDERYTIKDFTAISRAKLIRKWQECGENVSESYIHKVENTLNTVLGKNLIPSRPLYLLTILQSTSSTGSSEIADAGMSYYYQYLITKSLEETGVNRSTFDELFNYLSSLAWYFKCHELDAIDGRELAKFNDEFSNKFTRVDLTKQLSILTSAKIVSGEGDGYRFSYPYIKYFFVGKYLADHMENEEVNVVINQYCSNLYTREDSTTILFLTHHRSSDWVIENIAERLVGCYKDVEPVKYGDESEYISNLIGSVSNILIEDLDVQRNKNKRRLVQDEDVEPSDEYLIREKEEKNSNEVHVLYTAIRSAEVLGQITKNYYGSMERSYKRRNIKTIIDVYLRMLGKVFEEISGSEDSIRMQLDSKIKRVDKNLSNDEVKQLSSKIVGELTSVLSAGIIFKATETIYSDRLLEDIESLASDNENNAYLLVQAASYLMSPSTPPVSKIKNILKVVDGSVVAKNVLQHLALYHIQMFDTPLREKQALGDLLGIKFSKTKPLNRVSPEIF